MLEEKLPLLHV